MAEPDEKPQGGAKGGGMAVLTHKAGPLPVWAWAGLGVVLVVFVFRRRASAATPAQDAAAVGDGGGGSGGGGGGHSGTVPTIPSISIPAPPSIPTNIIDPNGGAQGNNLGPSSIHTTDVTQAGPWANNLVAMVEGASAETVSYRTDTKGAPAASDYLRQAGFYVGESTNGMTYTAKPQASGTTFFNALPPEARQRLAVLLEHNAYAAAHP